MNNWTVQPFSGRKSVDRHKLLGWYHWVEKRLNRVAIYLERLRMLALGNLEGFCMYMHYGCVDAIPT